MDPPVCLPISQTLWLKGLKLEPLRYISINSSTQYIPFEDCRNLHQTKMATTKQIDRQKKCSENCLE